MMAYALRCTQKILTRRDDVVVEEVCGTRIVMPDPAPGQLKTETSCPRCDQRWQVAHYPPLRRYVPPERKILEGNQ